jgi:thymidine kinase
MSLHIYLGPMFAGKSSMILRIVNRYKSINKNVFLVSNSIDNRYSKDQYIINHDLLKLPCERRESLMDFTKDDNFIQSQIILVDESQFFPDLLEFVTLATDILGKEVYLFGLDGDTERKPFGQLLQCIPMADDVVKLKAFCKLCCDGTEALFTFCEMKKQQQICVGGEETYMPLCRKHYCEFTAKKDL